MSQKFSLCHSKIPCVFPVWKNQESNSLFSLCRGHPVMFLHLSVSHSVHGGGSRGVCHTPPADPLQTYTPPAQCMRAVRIPLESILVLINSFTSMTYNAQYVTSCRLLLNRLCIAAKLTFLLVTPELVILQFRQLLLLC